MSAGATFYEGGKPGRRTAVSPKSLSQYAALRPLQVRVPLGTGAVSTQTILLGIMPASGGKVQSIKFAGQAAVTGTSITAEVFKRSADGNSTTTLQASATDIKLTASTDEVALSATLTATTADRTVAGGLVLECTITCSSITAGPGDLIIDVEFVPSEDSTSGSISTGADLL